MWREGGRERCGKETERALEKSGARERQVGITQTHLFPPSEGHNTCYTRGSGREHPRRLTLEEETSPDPRTEDGRNVMVEV